MAVGLRLAGWRVTVLERSARLGEVGAGVLLWSNALSALAELGVAQSIRELGTTRGAGGVQTPRGRWLSRSSGTALQHVHGVSVLVVHRAELHQQLRSALPDDALITGAAVTTVAQDEGSVTACYRTESGEHTLTADLLVGADGLHSRTRRALWPEAPQPVYAGFTAWRGVTDGVVDLVEQSQTWGRGAEFGLTRLIDGRIYWFGTANEAAGTTFDDEHAEVLRRFGDWHAPIAEVIQATPAETLLRHDIYHHPRPFPLFARDRVALLGDAAHAMTPNLGQGACTALEDAVVLAAELAAADVPRALQRYDAARRPRTQTLAQQSERLGRIAQAHHPIATGLRTLLVASAPTRISMAALARPTDWRAPTISAARPR